MYLSALHPGQTERDRQGRGTGESGQAEPCRAVGVWPAGESGEVGAVSRRVAERERRLAEMFPAEALVGDPRYRLTPDQFIVFNHFNLSRAPALMAMYSARRCKASAAACYAAIARSLVAR